MEMLDIVVVGLTGSNSIRTKQAQWHLSTARYLVGRPKFLVCLSLSIESVSYLIVFFLKINQRTILLAMTNQPNDTFKQRHS